MHIRTLNRQFNYIVLILLFIIPFFWFQNGEVDFGGDSTRLYIFDPDVWNDNIAYYVHNPVYPLSGYNPNVLLISLNWGLSLIKRIIGGNPSILNAVLNGFLLNGMYFGVYLSVMTFFRSTRRSTKHDRICAVFAGFFYALSPVLFYETFYKALYMVYGYAVYPWIFYLLLKYVESKKNHFLLLLILISIVFSVNFSIATSAWLFAFCLFALPFIIIYFFLNKENHGNGAIIKDLLLFCILMILCHAYTIIPELQNIFDSSTRYGNLLSEEKAINRGLAYFLSVAPHVRLIYNLTNQPQYFLATAFNHSQVPLYWSYGIRFHFLFICYPLILATGIFAALRLKLSNYERKVFFVLLGFFIMILFFMTANINVFFYSIYKVLFFSPIFQMFRSFYTKFASVFVFFYALVFGFALRYMMEDLKKKITRPVVCCLGMILIYQAYPLLAGKIAYEIPHWQTENVKLPVKFSDEYIDFLNVVRKIPLEASFIRFPLTDEHYDLVRGENGGAYLGPSALGCISGKKVFTGLGSFEGLGDLVKDSLRSKNNRLFVNLLAFHNIRYVIHNEDNFIYDNFPYYPYSGELKANFPDQQSIQKFLSAAGFKRMNKKYADHVLYYAPDQPFFPVWYMADRIILTDDFDDYLKYAKLKEDVNPIYIDKPPENSMLWTLPESADNDKTVVEFKKINNTKYRLLIHNFTMSRFITFLDTYYSGWKLYPVKSTCGQREDTSLPIEKGYKKMVRFFLRITQVLK